jgi:site-specific recombinase XerD
MLLENAIGEFLADLELAGRAPLTRKRHRVELGLLGRWIESEGLQWQEMSRKQLQGYLRLRAGLSASARANMLCSFRVFFSWALDQEYIARSPAVNFKTPTRPHPLPRALTLHQVRQLVTHLAGGAGRRARRDEAMLLTALYAGLRGCELATLHWAAVDLAGGIINIRISKMNKGRAVPIHPALLDVLIKWREIQQLDSSAPVFALADTAIAPGRVVKIAQKARAGSGVQFTTHELRHTFATWALRKSKNLYAVSKSLGHSQLRQTEIYVSAEVSDLRDAVNQLPGVADW